jgi:hypothetical protein
MMVAVGFSPRNADGMQAFVAERPLMRAGLVGIHFMRRSATLSCSNAHRGLKPTATVEVSLRDTEAPSRSEAMMVAVGFSPRNGGGSKLFVA